MAHDDLERPARVASALTDQLDECGLRYAIGGAVALGVWGVPRATADLDISVFVGDDRLEDVFTALERAGAIIDYEDAKRRVASASLFMARVLGVRVDVFLAHHPVHEDFARRRRSVRDPFGIERWYLSPEDVVLTKLIYRRPKDILDLERLFAVRQGDLDVDYIRAWLEQIVGGTDERLAILDDLHTRFAAIDD